MNIPHAKNNLYQTPAPNRENKEQNDNDIKFQYINAANGISPEELYKLEDVFHYNRDKKIIKEIRQNVKDHEHRVKERAEDLERARLKEAQAENLEWRLRS